MNKTLLAAALLLGATAQAQVGINTAEPKATLHVNSKNPAAGVEGIVYPHATQAEIESWNKADIEEGTIVWNTLLIIDGIIIVMVAATLSLHLDIR